jgi:DNA ligase-1
MILYTRGARGTIYVWEIEIRSNSYLLMTYGQKGGLLQEQREYIDEGKQGRSIKEQLESRFWSRVNKMRDRGYVDSLDKLTDKVFNKLGFKRPMLAQPLNKVNDIDWSTAIVQPKYDGHRCLITNHLGDIIAYSRNGKLIETISHILDDLYIPEGMTIDGELYCHGMSLQRISSYVKKKQTETSLINYVCYDVIDDRPYLERFDNMKSLLRANNSLMYAPVIKVFNKFQAKEKMMEYRETGYEGAILRHGDTSYQDGYRSKSLVKIKTTMDGYFEIIDIESSREGWGVLVCKIDDKKFNVSAPGTIQDKEFMLRNKHDFIGRDARVEFAYYTPDGIPFHPVAVDIGKI